MGDKNSQNIGISIPNEMFDWLEKPANKKINRSRLFQDAVNEQRYPQHHKITPMSYLIVMFGMTFGVSSLVASASGIFDFLMSTTFFMLGAVILLSSLVTLIKERKAETINQ